jgi:hypothetical protein
MPRPSTLRLIRNAAALAAASPTLFWLRLELEECRALQTERPLLGVRRAESAGECVFQKLLFIPVEVHNTKLCAWGEEDSGGHVL